MQNGVGQVNVISFQKMLQAALHGDYINCSFLTFSTNAAYLALTAARTVG